MWSYVLKRHHILRLTDLQGGANVGTMLYNRDHLLERLNLPDTLKAQHTAKLTTGFVLYSDMGRLLCSIVADSCGWHDPLSGHSNRKLVEQKYGPSRYQDARNDFYRNAHDQFLIELGKWGLGKPDLVANVNFFSKVTVNEEGSMQFGPNNSRPGDYVELRAEMNVLVVLNTCPHPMDPNLAYQPRPVGLTVYPSSLLTAEDECRTSCEENIRGSILTDALFR
jgi:uncharacterized protein